jgi:hypothetical protein
MSHRNCCLHLYSESWVTNLRWNIDNYIQVDAASCLRRQEYSSSLLWQTQILQRKFILLMYKYVLHYFSDAFETSFPFFPITLVVNICSWFDCHVKLQLLCSVIITRKATIRGEERVVPIATRYELDGPRFESWWRPDFPQPSMPVSMSTQPSVQWVPVFFPGDKAAGEWRWPSTPLLVWNLKKRLELYIYSPSVPSWHVTGRTLPYLYILYSVKLVEISKEKVENSHLYL